jgi:hypothetical protein
MAIRSAETYFDPRDNQAKLARGVGLVKDEGEVDPIRHAGARRRDLRWLNDRRGRELPERIRDSPPPIAQIDFKDQI